MDTQIVIQACPSVAAWMWHLFAGDIVERTSLQQMLPPEPPAGPDHGLGMERLGDLGSAPVFGQTRGKTGYESILAVFPDSRVVIALFVNEQDYIVEPVVRDLLDAAMR